tara:strand:+ start:607 stop:1134 length:528 start_codon:yes stop_codon:yes gene_type:complete
MALKIIFLDRDGVINKDIGYLHQIEHCEFIGGVFQACRYLILLGYQIVIVTNQSGIGRGLFTQKDFQILTNWMINQFENHGIDILDIFHCPHLPDSDCHCRKPKPGMILKAEKKYNINLKESWMIGDSEKDIIAASLAGIPNTILVGSGYKIDEENSQAKYYLNSIKDIGNVVKF